MTVHSRSLISISEVSEPEIYIEGAGQGTTTWGMVYTSNMVHFRIRLVGFPSRPTVLEVLGSLLP